MPSSCHCLACGKEYKYWKCIHKHYKKEHPDNQSIFRTFEIMDAMDKEAEMFIKYASIGKWV